MAQLRLRRKLYGLILLVRVGQRLREEAPDCQPSCLFYEYRKHFALYDKWILRRMLGKPVGDPPLLFGFVDTVIVGKGCGGGPCR